MKGKAPHTFASMKFPNWHFNISTNFQVFPWIWIHVKIRVKLTINHQFQISKYEPNKFNTCSKRLNIGHEKPESEQCWKFWLSKSSRIMRMRNLCVCQVMLMANLRFCWCKKFPGFRFYLMQVQIRSPDPKSIIFARMKR